MENNQEKFKGFLYEKEEGVWVLCKEPNLKKCCIDKKGDPLVVRGDFSHLPKDRVVIVEGMLVEKKGVREIVGSEVYLQERSIAMPLMMAAILLCAVLFWGYAKLPAKV